MFKVIWFAFCILFVIRIPLWLLYGEYHIFKCAFMSPVTMLFLSCVKRVKVFVMY